ncbi:hypothetical protein [Nostocoides jenkinsii]|uniref:Uncharacterized protein n=1 Tax=Nostocoides jenkinsii Ben 74 TaxID=1193518 RepID=A0A077MBW4_9MICO|nr:hypothetical protein [Tetrasphaera jenkinsii]CCI52178.1 hypothetical protein BN13_150039 [Tetrasphaera jenkinsii Ben 74]
MATKTPAKRIVKTPKPVETVEAAALDEALPAIEAAIQQVVDTFGVTVQRARLKGIRALAYQALVESIEAGDLEALTERAIGKSATCPPAGLSTRPSAPPRPTPSLPRLPSPRRATRLPPPKE